MTTYRPPLNTDFDKMLEKSIYAMPLAQLKELELDTLRFLDMIRERIQQVEAPPPLGVNVSEGISQREEIGGKP